MRFDTDVPSFVARTESDYALVALDTQSGRARKVAVSPGREILSLMNLADSRTLVVRRESREDLWLREGERRERLTSDGVSVSGAMSSNGLLLSQKFLPEGGLAIFLRTPGSGEKRVTRGPVDVTPAFYPDGSRWVYASVASKQILKCDVQTSTCAVVLTDQMGPGFPSVDPTSRRLAYVTFNNPSRLRLAPLDGGGAQRDLGPAAGVCSPVWASDDRLWFVQTASGSQMTWSEISVDTGATTGRVEKVHATSQNDCRLPGALRSSSDRERPTSAAEVVSLPEEASDMLVTSRSSG